MNVFDRNLWKLGVLVVAALAFAASPAFCEDPFQLKLKNPTRYEMEFTNAHNEKVGDLLEIEKVNDHTIKFYVLTIDAHDRVCELSGVARARKKDTRDFVFTHARWKKCGLHFTISPDGRSVVSTDLDGNCARHFCNGYVDGISFKKVR